MELRQFRRFTDEKMALDAAEIDQLCVLLARSTPPRSTSSACSLPNAHIGW
jgi:hypothetical protein